MFINAVKLIIRKFEATDSLDVVPGRRRRTIAPVIVEEVEIATAEANTRSSNAIICGRSIAWTLDIPWATMRMILHKILKP